MVLLSLIFDLALLLEDSLSAFYGHFVGLVFEGVGFLMGVLVSVLVAEIVFVVLVTMLFMIMV